MMKLIDAHRRAGLINGSGPIRDLRLPIGSGRAESESSRRGEAFRSACKSPALREVAFAPSRDRLELRDQSASLRGSGVSRLVRDGREMTSPAARRSESGFRRLPSDVLL